MFSTWWLYLELCVIIGLWMISHGEGGHNPKGREPTFVKFSWKLHENEDN